MVYCTNCGAKLDESQKFCTSCGTPISDKAGELQNDNKGNSESEINPTIGIKDTVVKEANTNRYYNMPKEEFAKHALKSENKIVSKSESKSRKKWHIPILIVLVLLLGLSVVFMKQIKGGYYLIRYNTESNTEKKFEFACESMKNLRIDSSATTFKAAALELIKKNDVNVENKIIEFKSYLKEEDFNELNKELYNQKALNYAEQGKFEDAFSSLMRLNDYGVDIRSNKSYEIIMLNIISKLTNSPVYDTKDVLQERNTIYFDNLDEDPYDEIIEVKDLSPGDNYLKIFELNLYEVKNNKYQKVYSEKTSESEAVYDVGIYNYDKSKKGFFLSLSYGEYTKMGTVYKVINNSLVNLGKVGGYYSCSIEDLGNDGIYEIVSVDLDMSYGSNYSYVEAPRIAKWYKFSDIANNNVELIKEEKRSGVAIYIPSSSYPNMITNNDFIFYDSNKRYLIDSELSMLSKEELGIARNEIFARHGFVFKTAKYIQYFNSKSWYMPNPSYDGDESALNEYERSNYKLIQKWEK